MLYIGRVLAWPFPSCQCLNLFWNCLFFICLACPYLSTAARSYLPGTQDSQSERDRPLGSRPSQRSSWRAPFNRTWYLWEILIPCLAFFHLMTKRPLSVLVADHQSLPRSFLPKIVVWWYRYGDMVIWWLQCWCPFDILSLGHVVDAIWYPKTIVGFILLELVRKSLHLVPDNVDYTIVLLSTKMKKKKTCMWPSNPSHHLWVQGSTRVSQLDPSRSRYFDFGMEMMLMTVGAKRWTFFLVTCTTMVGVEMWL